MNPRHGASAYANVGVQSSVLSASPHQLIVMLFDGAQTAIRMARLHMQTGNIAGKGQAISKAIDIVNLGLVAALDHERGGDLAAQLGQLYDYITRQLMRANLNNDEACLDEAAKLLEEVGSAWREISP